MISTLSLSIMVSLSRIISLRSIETLHQYLHLRLHAHVFNTRAANFLPIYFLSPVLDFNFLSKVKNLKDILVSSNPIARNKVVTGNFFLVDISVHYTIDICRKFYPRSFKGITLAEYNFVPLA
jgi:hypothetical protein